MSSWLACIVWPGLFEIVFGCVVVFCSVGWILYVLGSWFAGRLVGRLLGWLVGCLGGWVGWLAGLAAWLVGWLACFLVSLFCCFLWLASLLVCLRVSLVSSST